MKCTDILLYEFLSGSLRPSEAEKTASHLEQCRECRERFKIMLALDGPRKPAVRKKSNRYLPAGRNLRLAAAALLLAAVLSILYSQFPTDYSSPVSRTLATSEPYPLVMLETRNSSGANISRGLHFYREGNYREAFAELEKHEENHDALFFSAISLYMLDEPVKASEKLKRLAAISEKWAPAADWYRAQSLLKLGETAEAVIVLKKISETESQYKEKALAQLKKLGEQ